MNKHFLPILLIPVLVLSCTKVWHQADNQDQLYTINEEVKEVDQDIQSFLEPYKLRLDSQMNKVIGQLDHSINKQKPESTLGNWVADMILKKTSDYFGKPVDFAICNYGGLRIPSISEGPVSIGKIYELMPFDNTVIVLELDKNTMIQLFDHMAKNGGWPISTGISYAIQSEKAVDIQIQGKPLENNRTYYLAVSDFVANGGDNSDFLKNRPKTTFSKLYRDAMIEFIVEETNAGRTLSSKIENRVVLK